MSCLSFEVFNHTPKHLIGDKIGIVTISKYVSCKCCQEQMVTLRY